MNDLLMRNYFELFYRYPTDWVDRILFLLRLYKWVPRLKQLFAIKARIKHQLERYELRPDAALFLLSAFDHMLIRPYQGEIGRKLEVRPVGTEETTFAPVGLEERLLLTLDLIVKELASSEVRDVSAHAVMQAVDRQWSAFTRIFWWE